MWPWNRRGERRVQDAPIEPTPKRGDRPWMSPRPSIARREPASFDSIMEDIRRQEEMREAIVQGIADAAAHTLGDGDIRTLPGIPAQTRLAWNPSGKPVIVISADDPSLAFSAMARAWPTCETFSLSVTPDPGFRYATAIAPHGA